MSLNERLRAISEKSAGDMPDPVKEAMQRGKEQIRASVGDSVLGAGGAAPRFARPDHEGETVRLDALLERGPVILSFYRGKW